MVLIVMWLSRCCIKNKHTTEFHLPFDDNGGDEDVGRWKEAV